MTLKERIEKDFITAFKQKDRVSKDLLSVIKSEVQTLEKNTQKQVSDNEVEKILTKLVKSIKETMSNKESDTLNRELSIVESYLPKQMSREEITEKVQSLIDSGAKNMGDFMKGFNGLPVDRKLVNQIVNQMTKV